MDRFFSLFPFPLIQERGATRLDIVELERRSGPHRPIERTPGRTEPRPGGRLA